MSEPRIEGSEVGVDEEDGGGDDVIQKDDQNQKKPKSEQRVKRVSLFRFRKVKKQQVQRRNKWRVGVGGGGCCFCMKQPETLDSSPGESQTSDPNNQEFSYEMLRALIEKSDFCSKECNTHLDINDLPSSYADDK